MHIYVYKNSQVCITMISLPGTTTEKLKKNKLIWNEEFLVIQSAYYIGPLPLVYVIGFSFIINSFQLCNYIQACWVRQVCYLLLFYWHE